MSSKKRPSRVAAAAAQLLQARVALIEDLDAAVHRETFTAAQVDRARQHARDAVEHTSQAYRAALDGGWTVGELRDLGYADRRSRRSTARRPHHTPDGHPPATDEMNTKTAGTATAGDVDTARSA